MDRITYDGKNLREALEFFNADLTEPVDEGQDLVYQGPDKNLLIRAGESFVKNNGIIEREI